MSGDYGDIKIDKELYEIVEDVAEQFYGQKYASVKTMGEEAVLLWALIRVQPVATDVVDDVLADHGYDDVDALIDDVRANHATAMDDTSAGGVEDLFNSDALRAIQQTLHHAVGEDPQ